MSFMRSRTAGAMVTTAIVGLALAASYIHLGLGGLLFTMNGLGYLGLAVLFAVAAASRHPMVMRFSWAPRVMLGGYAVITITGYLVMGPYFSLGWITKGIEVALIGLLTVDVFRVYGSPFGLVRGAWASVFQGGASAAA